MIIIGQFRISTYALRTTLLLASILVGGCLSGDGSSDDPTPSPPVGPPNSPPTISGSPAPAVTIGTAYSFTPISSDADGDVLTFEIARQPGWASFDPSTGRVSGSPTLGDIGRYDDIQITVSDNTTFATLPTFSVDVVASALGSLTVSWVPPTFNEDGSPLLDLSGYMLYYGTSQSDLNSQIVLNNPGITTYIVENLTPNSYFFSATSYNSLGVESRRSDVSMGVVN